MAKTEVLGELLNRQIPSTAAVNSTWDMVDGGSFGGLTPKFCVLRWTIDGGNGNETTSVNQGIGYMVEGNKQFCIGFSDQDGAATTNSASAQSNTLLAFAPSFSGSTEMQLEGSFITNGLRVTVKNSPGYNFRISALLFAGDGIVETEMWSGSNSTTLQQTETAPGFRPDMVFSLTNGFSSSVGLAGRYCDSTVVRAYRGENVQRSMCQSLCIDDASSSSDHIQGTFLNDYFHRVFNTGASAMEWYSTLDEFTDTGFKWTADAATGADVHFAAIKFDTPVRTIISFGQIPTSGNYVLGDWRDEIAGSHGYSAKNGSGVDEVTAIYTLNQLALCGGTPVEVHNWCSHGHNGLGTTNCNSFWHTQFSNPETPTKFYAQDTGTIASYTWTQGGTNNGRLTAAPSIAVPFQRQHVYWAILKNTTPINVGGVNATEFRKGEDLVNKIFKGTTEIYRNRNY